MIFYNCVYFFIVLWAFVSLSINNFLLHAWGTSDSLSIDMPIHMYNYKFSLEKNNNSDSFKYTYGTALMIDMIISRDLRDFREQRVGIFPGAYFVSEWVHSVGDNHVDLLGAYALGAKMHYFNRLLGVSFGMAVIFNDMNIEYVDSTTDQLKATIVSSYGMNIRSDMNFIFLDSDSFTGYFRVYSGVNIIPEGYDRGEQPMQRPQVFDIFMGIGVRLELK